MSVKAGKHLGVVRSWMQRFFLNGETVVWGSREELKPGPRILCQLECELLAQDIRDAVLREFHCKDTDHKFEYVVCAEGGCSAFQDCDTLQEIWTALFLAQGDVGIYKRNPDNTFGERVFSGTADEVRQKVMEAARDKDQTKFGL